MGLAEETDLEEGEGGFSSEGGRLACTPAVAVFGYHSEQPRYTNYFRD